MLHKLLWTLSVLLPLTVADAHAGSNPTALANLSYGPDPQETLNLWTPPSSSYALPRPLVIIVHGGSFITGDKDGEINGYAQRISRFGGFVVANIDYRLASSVAPTTDQINDVQLAVRYLRANHVRYGIDPGYICLDGWSAGGTLIMAAGMSRGIYPGDRAALLTQESTSVRCLADNSGPTYIQVNGTNTSILSMASSLTPPMYISQGLSDPTVDKSNAQGLVSALQTHRVPYIVNYYNGGHVMHGLTTTQQQAILDAETAFFGKQMYF